MYSIDILLEIHLELFTTLTYPQLYETTRFFKINIHELCLQSVAKRISITNRNRIKDTVQLICVCHVIDCFFFFLQVYHNRLFYAPTATYAN